MAFNFRWVMVDESAQRILTRYYCEGNRCIMAWQERTIRINTATYPNILGIDITAGSNIVKLAKWGYDKDGNRIIIEVKVVLEKPVYNITLNKYKESSAIFDFDLTDKDIDDIEQG